MRYIIFIFISCWYSVGISQTIENVMENLDYIKVNTIRDFGLLKTIIESKNNIEFVGFQDSVYHERVVFVSSKKLFLFLNYNSDGILVAFNVFDYSSKPLFYWEIESLEFQNHRINMYFRNQKKTLLVGCQKGKRCKYHGFSKNLFTGITLSKNHSELDLMLSEIIRKHKIMSLF